MYEKLQSDAGPAFCFSDNLPGVKHKWSAACNLSASAVDSDSKLSKAVPALQVQSS